MRLKILVILSYFMESCSTRYRTNYFRVRDLDAFLMMAERFGLEFAERDGLVALLAVDPANEGTFPSCDFEKCEETGDGSIDFMQLLSEHLAEGSIAVVIQNDIQSRRSVHVSAVTVDQTGKTVVCKLARIDGLAETPLGDEAGGDANEHVGPKL